MIYIDNVSKAFGTVQAVDAVSLQINEGELFACIGPDGAGKTTLFRMINSLIVPDEGQIKIFGLDPVADYFKVRRIIGYMPGKFSLYTDLSIEENLNFFATVFGTSIDKNYHLIEDIYKQIEPFRKRLAGQLSGGMKQKLALSCALIHKPRLLILDEPTTGVDAVSRREFWDMLKVLKLKGLTVIVSTPYMDEASMCDRVALMQNGRVHVVEKPQVIVDQYKEMVFAVKSENNYQSLLQLRKWEHCANVYPFGESLHYLDKRQGAKAKDIEQYLKQLEIAGVKVDMVKPDIEDCFIKFSQSETQ